MKSARKVSGVFLGFAAFGLILGGAACTPKKKESPNTLHLATQSKIKGIDPAFADDLYSGREVGKVYEGLLQYHYLKRPYALIPNLAEAMPEISADGKTLTFKLKKGVLFQDDASFKATGGKGRELTADDVVYSFKRLADPKVASSGWWLFDGKIAGLNEWREASSKAGSTDYSKVIDGLKAVDRYTVQIVLTNRSAQFLYALAMPFTGIVPREAVEAYGKEFINHPVGTGPFKLEEFNGASRVIWVRNPTYRKELYPSDGDESDKARGLLADAGKQIPFVDRIELRVIEESQPLWLTFLQGKLDTAGIPKDNFSSAVTASKELSPELKAKGIELLKEPNADVTHFSFNMDDPVVGKNKLLRQAMSLAYDEAKYIETFYNGRGVPAQGPIPPDISGFDPAFKNPYRQYNIAKARELMSKAGFPGGKGLAPIVFATMSDSTSRQSADFAQQMFGQIGVQLKVDTYSWPQFQETIKNRKAQLWSFAWGADYPDGENFLQLFYSKNKSPGPNDAGYSNPEFDKLYEQALKLQDTPERTALYRKMAQLVVEDCPWIFGTHRIQFQLLHPWLKNLKLHEFDHVMLKYLRIDTAAKEAAEKK